MPEPLTVAVHNPLSFFAGGAENGEGVPGVIAVIDPPVTGSQVTEANFVVVKSSQVMFPLWSIETVRFGMVLIFKFNI